MRIALIFGAGATLANAVHFAQEREKKVDPPLDTTFFETVQELGISVPPALRDYARGLPTGSPFDVPQGSRVEEFFKDLFHDFLSETGTSAEIVDAYTDLVDIYRRVIRDTTDWIGEDRCRGGPVGRLVATAVGASDSTTLMTFNHDLLLENEIYKRSRLRRLWCVEHGYGRFSDGRKVTAGKTKAVFDPHSSTCDSGERLKILKLHGSLNWYVRMQGKRPSPNVLAGRSGNQNVMITRRRKVPGQLRSTRPNRSGRTSWYTWPVIVPPVYNKQALIQRFLPDVWKDARTELSRCDRALFFGYALPTADIEAEKLFQRSLAANEQLSAVHVVNPDPSTAERYARLLPMKALKWYPDIKEYMADTPF
jgi:hypothetical protein